MPRAYNVFHVSKLKKYVRSDHETGPLSVVIDADGTTEQEVIAILSKKRENRKAMYLVQFEGDPDCEAVWMPKSALSNCKHLLHEFEKKTRASSSKRG